MRADAIVVGGELDGLVAAVRLAELGRRVRIFMRGAGSLLYAPGGIHVLGFSGPEPGETVQAPFEAIASLDPCHPYRLVGADRVRRALDWFLAAAAGLGQSFTASGGNAAALTPAGLPLPTYAPWTRQATLGALTGKRVAVAALRGYRDFPASLFAGALARHGIAATRLDLDPPGGRTDTVALARAFDRFAEPEAYFRDLAAQLRASADLVLFPAVLGLERHDETVAAAAVAGLPLVEVPTLPPSVPGLRLWHALNRRLARAGVTMHQGVAVRGRRGPDGRVVEVLDERGRPHAADVFVLASGGVLMGGLEVDSRGRVAEPVFGLDVHQTAPLDAARPDLALDALHEAGVEADQQLRPRPNGSAAPANLFVTGSTLAHWSPAREASAEGVSIATGWAAAEAAHALLEGR
jgi:glycerol-3-phosphate dehydrogenase subunit B